MKYSGMPSGMWMLFAGSFRKNLTDAPGFTAEEASRIMKAAKPEYRKIIEKLPEFEKEDRFKMNIVSCAMLSSVILHMPRKLSLEQMTKYYRNGMMNGPMRLFCRLSGKKKFSDSDIRGMETTAKFRAADRNPYSWNMEFMPYKDGNGYECRFSRCGICTLMKELGLFEYVPAMCRLDYTMSEAGGVSDFVRKYTLASGGPYCDCGYRKKRKS